MIVLFPRNPDPHRFANKYKNLLSAVATGFQVYANNLQGFDQLLDPKTGFLPPYKEKKGYDFATWRLLVTQYEQRLLEDPVFQDKYPERYDTNCREVQAIYGTHPRVIDGKFNKIPKHIQKRIMASQEWIPWNDEMKHIFDSIPRLHRCIGVSVRTWQGAGDTNGLAAERAKTFNPQKYLDLIAKYEGKVEGIFFSFDHPQAEQLFKDVKIPKVQFKLPSLTPMQKAAVEAKILGSCGLLIGDHMSTYPEVAWWMGGCQADVLLV